MQYGMVKHYREYDENGILINEVKLTFNAITFLLYMNYTGRDLMVDFNAMGMRNANKLNALRPEVKEQLQNNTLDFSTLTESDVESLAALNSSENNMFMLDFIASLIATSKYPQTIEYADIINEIPLGMLYDEQCTKDLYDLMLFGLSKKKIVKVQG